MRGKNRRRLWGGLLGLALALALVSPALACSPTPWAIRARCTTATDTAPAGPYSIGLTANSVSIVTAGGQPDAAPIVDLLDELCQEPLATPAMQAAIQGWLHRPKEYLWDYALIIEPHTAARAQDLERQLHEYGSCRHQPYQVIDGWLAITDTTRPYCSVKFARCTTYGLSLLKLNLFALTNLSRHTAPYLLWLLVPAALLLAGWRWLARRGKLRQFFTFHWAQIPLVGGPLALSCLLWSPMADIPLWIAVFYLISCAIHYHLRDQALVDDLG